MRPGLTVAVYSRSAAARAGLRELLAHDGAEAVAYLGGPPPDVDLLVVDLVPGDAEGRALLEEAEGAALPALVLADELPREAATGWGASSGGAPRSLARGWLRRDAEEDELLAAARAVAAGLTVLDPSLEVAQGSSTASADGVLTDREREVLGWLAAGLTNRAIALELGISEHTAKFHVGAVLAKLGAQSRTEAVATAVRAGLLAL